MIKTYLLPVERIDNTDTVKGAEYIHNAILEGTDKPDMRRLIMDTTPDEDSALSTLAVKVEEPTQRDIDNYASLPEPIITHNLEAEIDNLKARIERLEKK